jgi:tRNA-Thr(GGU) m(6)t(6)A37 methyltransferase TsaA
MGKVALIVREGDLALNQRGNPRKQDVRMWPIGIVHTNESQDEIRQDKKGIRSEIEIFPGFEDALDGVEGFSHIFIIAFLNQLRPEQIGQLKVRPRGLLRQGLNLDELPLVGVFALDSPTRPNPIGLSIVPLLRRDGRTLTVSDLDLFDGTPVLDIKPYQSSYRTKVFKVPDWHARLLRKAGRV